MRYAIVSIVFFLTIGFVFAASNPGHPASEIDPGIFANGGYIFPATVSVGNVLAVNTIQGYTLGTVSIANPLIVQNLANCGKVWTDASGQLNCGVDATANYNFITGLVQTGNDVMINSSYRLPQNCANGQVAKSNGAGVWSCQSDQVGVGGGGSVNGSGTDYWIPRWNGTSGIMNSIMYQAVAGGKNWIMYQGGINASEDICTRSGGVQKCLSSVTSGATYQQGQGIEINSTNYINLRPCGVGLILKAGPQNTWNCAADDTGSGAGGNVTGSGTFYWIARWNGTTSLADSFMYQVNNGGSNNWVMVANAGVNASGDICTRVGGTQKCLSNQGASSSSGGGNGWTNTTTSVYTTDSTDNVGIGTSTPGYKLQVAGGDIVASGYVAGTTFVASNLALCNGTNTIKADASGRLKCEVDVVGSGGANGWTDTGTVVMLETSTDKVGVGMTPSGFAKMGIQGQLEVNHSNVGGQSVFRYGRTYLYIQPNDGSGSAANVLLGAYNSAEGHKNLILSPVANVGIGTNTPNSKLEVNGDIALNGAIKSSTGGDVIIQLG
jgi:hypothetical protein